MNGTLNLISSKKHAAYLAVSVKGHRNIHKMTDENVQTATMYMIKNAFLSKYVCIINQNGVN